MNLPPNVTIDEILEAAASDENLGYCLACGNCQGECEPDARHYFCDNCRLPQVYGAEELVIMNVA